jgi:hypothetical protein
MDLRDRPAEVARGAFVRRADAEEGLVDEVADRLARRKEQRDRQPGGSELRGLDRRPAGSPEALAQKEPDRDVDCRQHRRQRGVDEAPPDDHVDVHELVADDRDRERRRHRQREQPHHVERQDRRRPECARQHVEQHERQHPHADAPGHPLRLAALARQLGDPAVAPQQRRAGHGDEHDPPVGQALEPAQLRPRALVGRVGRERARVQTRDGAPPATRGPRPRAGCATAQDAERRTRRAPGGAA